MTIDYDLARKAMNSILKDKSAIDNLANQKLEEIKSTIIESCKFTGEDPGRTWISDKEKTNAWIESYTNALPQSFGEIENRLNQNELIMKVSLFEILLKDIHREILKQKTSLLQSDRKIPLGKLIHGGQDKLIDEEIERAVNILERKNIRDIAQHFKDHLNVDWTFDGHILPIVEHVLSLRNKILHEEPDVKVGNDDCFHAITIYMAISLVAIAQCAILYPGGFEPLKDDSNVMEYYREKLKNHT